MELRHLKYFTVIAEELHFRRAAEKLNISQPPLSQQLKQLENELQVKLFYRTNRSVELTEAGSVLLEKAYNIFNYLDDACEETRGVHRGEIGELTLGYSGSAVFDLIPTIIHSCNQLFPNLTLDLKQLTTSEQIKALEERKIQVGVLVPPLENPNLVTQTIREEKLVVCLPNNHPLAQGRAQIDARELATENFIMPPRQAGHGYYEAIKNIFKDAGFTPTIVQTAKEQHTMVSLVAAGIGIVIVPEYTQFIKLENVVYLPFNKTYPKITAMAWHKENRRPVVNRFISVVQEFVIPKF
ncbi:LysR family transcriptional regulator [Thalassobacillus devorans]|uniref:LysR family transcriptional regulator n=1 Tax=Thalassobacillus devorans TaxID=279813 RepID=A0ABQ1P0E4_9BACI|nr:LysR family transcriptional regulator [Thalassobacillus devorans]NIK28220.1 DNA-binding transcriptional LysR family regulator [Thalassobacillus devorans]GGC87954.1 LysR family transcriptional regulator [Thalassobacillus devorans]